MGFRSFAALRDFAYPRTVFAATSSKSAAIGDSSIRSSISRVCFTTAAFVAFQSRKSGLYTAANDITNLTQFAKRTHS